MASASAVEILRGKESDKCIMSSADNYIKDSPRNSSIAGAGIQRKPLVAEHSKSHPIE
jgi:hypothetical protein